MPPTATITPNGAFFENCAEVFKDYPRRKPYHVTLVDGTDLKELFDGGNGNFSCWSQTPEQIAAVKKFCAANDIEVK